MSSTSPWIRTMLAVFALLAAYVPPSGAKNVQWRRMESSAWIAIQPEHAVPRLRVEAVDSVGSNTLLPGRWMLLEPADTLHFAVRGEGELRVQTRAIFDSGAKTRRYRLGVLTAPSAWRNLIRHSVFQANVRWTGSMTTRRAAEVDQWETSLVAGSEHIAVTLREKRSAPVLLRVLVRGAIERPWSTSVDRASVPLERPRWKHDLEVDIARIGFDSNAYFTPSDVADTTEVSHAWYWPLAIAASMELENALPFDLSLAYDFSARKYEDAVLGIVRHRAVLRETWPRLGLGVLGSGKLHLQQHLRTKNDTFFGRGDDEEFETGSSLVPGERLGLGDRFDWRELGVTAAIAIRPARAWRFELESFWLWRDYIEDFDDEPEIYSLDQDRAGGEVTLRREFGPEWELTARLGSQWWYYEEKFARDADGVEMPTVATRLRRLPLELGLGHRPGRALRLDLELGTLFTEDLREGYWDRRSLIASGAARWDPRDRLSIGVRARRSVTHYHRARLDVPSVGPLRAKDSWRVEADLEFRASRNWWAFGKFAHTTRNNNLSIFAYERSVFETGLRAKF